MKNEKLIMYAALIGAFLAFKACAQDSTKITVLDEAGNAIKEAKVRFIYARARDLDVKEKQTNQRGFTEDSDVINFHLALRVNKEGYYESSYSRSNNGTHLEKNQDHDVTVNLRKIIEPIPLYAKNWRLISPVLDKEVGYDFKVGDWVKPFGKGEKNDIFFKVNYSSRSSVDYDYKLEVSFPNEVDGIQEFRGDVNSKLKSPHQAPSKGYQPKWEQKMQRRPGESRKGNRDPLRNYWLRVRSKVDDQGKLVSAHYVKIYGDFPDIKYYYNPTPNDRNLEFDPANNLFKNLSWEEEVREP